MTFETIKAKLISNLWSGSPDNRSLWTPPVGFYPTNKKFYVFVEFEEDTTKDKNATLYEATMFVNDAKVDTKAVLADNMNGSDFICFAYTFTKAGTYQITVAGDNKVTKSIVVKDLDGDNVIDTTPIYPDDSTTAAQKAAETVASDVSTAVSNTKVEKNSLVIIVGAVVSIIAGAWSFLQGMI